MIFDSGALLEAFLHIEVREVSDSGVFDGLEARKVLDDVLDDDLELVELFKMSHLIAQFVHGSLKKLGFGADGFSFFVNR